MIKSFNKSFFILLLSLISFDAYSGFGSWAFNKACGFKYFRALNGKFSKRSKEEMKLHIFGSKFEPKEAIKYVENLPLDQRPVFFKQLFKLADNDTTFNTNLSDLINEALEQKLIRRKDILEETNQIHGNSIFFFSDTSSKISSAVDVHPVTLKFIDDVTRKSELGEHYTKEYRRIILEGEFKVEELEILEQSLTRFPETKEAVETFEDYVYFLNMYSDKERLQALAYVDDIFTESSNSKFSKSFLKNQKKFKKYEEQEFAKLSKKYSEDNGKLSKKMKERAINEAKAKKQLKKRLSYGCRGKNPNRLSLEDSALMASRRNKFKKFATISSIPLATSSFVIANWDKEKDGEWWGKLSYEVGMGAAYSLVGAQFSSSQSTSFLGKFWASYKFNAGADVLSNSFYSYAFGVSDEDAQKAIDELKNDPNFDEKMEKMKEYIENERIVEKIEEVVQETFYSGEAEYELTSEELDKLTPEDLDRPEVRDAMLEIIVEKIYEDNSGELLTTGNRGVDRYTFYRAFSLLTIPKGVAIGILMYRAICSSVNPKKGMALAASMLLVNKFVIAPLEYKVREWAIGQ